MNIHGLGGLDDSYESPQECESRVVVSEVFAVKRVTAFRRIEEKRAPWRRLSRWRSASA
jgi:hypothetical protein